MPFERIIIFLAAIIIACWAYVELALIGVRAERDGFAKLSRDAVRADFLANIGEG